MSHDNLDIDIQPKYVGEKVNIIYKDIDKLGISYHNKNYGS